jgi:uracil-DNA glycosylase family 4
MSWSERQRAMLREMGIPAFWPVPAEVPQDETSPATVAQAPLVAAPVLSPDAVEARPAASAPTAAPASRPRPAAPTTAPTHLADLAAGAVAVLRERPAGIESMDWPTLRDTVAGCMACGLCEGRRNTVFGVGHPQARLMIIGEAPGEQEDRQGEPFVGRAGQLLDRMLEAIGLTRAESDAERQVFIANVLKCRPPGNRNPLPAEVAQCEPYLMRQIALVQPRIILAMGRFAAQSLLKSSEPIGRLRGRVHEVQGTPVVVTYHPAYLLRNPVDKALVWDDLCRARALLHPPHSG